MDEIYKMGIQIKTSVEVCSDVKSRVKGAKNSFRDGIIIASNHRKKKRYEVWFSLISWFVKKKYHFSKMLRDILEVLDYAMARIKEVETLQSFVN